MQLFQYERWLGDYFGISLAESAFQTVLKRKGLVSRLISEIKVTLEDLRAERVGGVIAGLEIWSKAVLLFLYSNSSVWVDFPKKAHDSTHINYPFFLSVFVLCSKRYTNIVKAQSDLELRLSKI